jgi:hypothetical protein
MLAVARDLNVPVRVNFEDLGKMPSHAHLADKIDAMGVLSPDVQVHVAPPGAAGVEAVWRAALESLRVGYVSEIQMHVGDASGEMQASVEDWSERVAHTEFLGSGRFKELIRDFGITLIGYRDLRHLQRTGSAPPGRAA